MVRDIPDIICNYIFREISCCCFLYGDGKETLKVQKGYERSSRKYQKNLYLMFKTKNKPQSYTGVRQPDSCTRKNQDIF